MAVNTVDELQFLSFMFAALLLITVHFIARRLGRAIMHQHTKILRKSVQIFLRYRFSRRRLATMLNFKGQNFSWKGRLEDRGTSPCQILSKLVYPSQRYCDFAISKNGRRRLLEFSNSWNFIGWGLTRIIMPNLVKISKSVPWYSDFSILQDGRRRYLG